MKSLNFGASCAPRMLHAASQVHDSSDLTLLLVTVPRLTLRAPLAGEEFRARAACGSRRTVAPFSED
jgi:hypothetical protein